MHQKKIITPDQGVLFCSTLADSESLQKAAFILSEKTEKNPLPKSDTCDTCKDLFAGECSVPEKLNNFFPHTTV